MSDKVPEQGVPSGSKDRTAKDEWVRVSLGEDPVRLRSKVTSIGGHRAPPPQWQSAKPSQEQRSRGPKLGQERDLEGKFNKHLGDEMDTIQLIRGLKPASKAAETAASQMETALGEMAKAAKSKDFGTADAKLTEALQFGLTVSDERVKAKTEFDKTFWPLQEKLNTACAHTKGLTGIAPSVGTAEDVASKAATAAENAVDDDDYALASVKLGEFTTAMNLLDTAHKNGADALDQEVTKKIGRLARRAEGLEGTALSGEATTAKQAVTKARQTQTNANKESAHSARLAALAGVRDDVDEADAAAQLALKTKANKGAADGLVEIRKAAGQAVAALVEGDAKTALSDRLKEWDKQRKACDEETDQGKKKIALAKCDKDARKIMADAAAAGITAAKDKAVNDANAAVGGEVPALILATRNAIAALTNGDVKTGLSGEANTWEQNYDLWAPHPDPTPGRADALLQHLTFWPGLLEKALKAAAEEKRQEAFKQALKKRFGLEITVPSGMSNTNFDQFYDMMDRLPVQQTSQDRLKKLVYDKDSKGAAFWPGGTGRIDMGNFGATETWNYKNPTTGVTEPMTAFSINTLHEIGHSVDDKYGIMAKHGNSTGCAGWKAETLNSVIAAFLKDLKASGGSTLTTADNVLRGLLNTALTKGAVTDPTTKITSVADMEDSAKPGTMGDPEWQIVKAQLKRAVTIRSANWPWGSGKAVVLEGRAYHESYSGKWVSYDPTKRAGTEVRDYQFRAPGEWFAELYAYTWYNKVKAPSGVDKAVTKYMYSAKH